jgi:hypothetical protein
MDCLMLALFNGMERDESQAQRLLKNVDLG